MTVPRTYGSFRHHLYDLLDPEPDAPRVERTVNALLAALIAVNLALTVVLTVPEWTPTLRPFARVVESVSLVVFGVEYLARLWVTPLRPHAVYAHPVWGRVRYALTPLALLDLLVLVSFVAGLGDLAALRALRLLKLLSLLKLGRYSQSLRLIGKVVVDRKEELLTMIVVVFALVLLSGTLMYFIEGSRNAQFRSIPSAMWWAVITLTTIGYGDAYPTSGLGRVVGGFIALLGVGMVALPTGLLANGFADELRRQRQKPCCPHCGKEME